MGVKMPASNYGKLLLEAEKCEIKILPLNHLVYQASVSLLSLWQAVDLKQALNS